MGEGESQLAQMLLDRGLKFVRQHPVERYNIDLALGNLAVEVHRPDRHPFHPRSRELARCENLLRLGWNVIYVWTRGEEITDLAADEIVSFYEVSRPPAVTSRTRSP